MPYLWALAQDSKGTVYYAGGAPTGATAKVFALPRTVSRRCWLNSRARSSRARGGSGDRVYAAVLPDAKIYRIDAAGKAELFFDPKCKYIWAMAFDRCGNLFVATGDSGLIYKVTPDGNGKKFLDTQETHARSMIIDACGQSDRRHRARRLDLARHSAGQSFVLYQANKREVTAVAEHEGLIYAAAIGSKPAGPFRFGGCAGFAGRAVGSCHCHRRSAFRCDAPARPPLPLAI